MQVKHTRQAVVRAEKGWMPKQRPNAKDFGADGERGITKQCNEIE